MFSKIKSIPVLGLLMLVMSLFPLASMGGETYKMSLNSGWSMKSVPLESTETDKSFELSTVLGTAAQSIHSVWSWDKDNNAWLVYPDTVRKALYGDSDTTHALSKLEAGKGYWFKTYSGAEISLAGTRPSTGTQGESITKDVFQMIGFSFQGEVDASYLDKGTDGEGTDRLIESNKKFFLWSWTGADWCIYTNDSEGITGVNKYFLEVHKVETFFKPCRTIAEGSSYWIQQFDANSEYKLSFPPSIPSAESNARGLSIVKIGDVSVEVAIFESDLVTPIYGVELSYDADKKTLTFEKKGYNTRTLTGIESASNLKSTYNLIKKDAQVTDVAPKNARDVTGAAADFKINNSQSTSRVLVQGSVGEVGALVQLTPMNTVAGVQGSDPETGQNELAALGKLIAGVTVFLGDRNNSGELMDSEGNSFYKALKGWNAKAIPAVTSESWLSASGGDGNVIGPVELDKLIYDPPDLGNNEIKPIGVLALYYFDPFNEDSGEIVPKWIRVGTPGEPSARLVGLNKDNAESLTSNDQTFNDNLKFIRNKLASPTFMFTKGGYGLEPITDENGNYPAELDELYPAYAYVLESEKEPQRCVQIRVQQQQPDEEGKTVYVKDASVTIDGMLEYTTDADGYLSSTGTTALPGNGTILMEPILGTKKMTIVAVGKRHYARTAEISIGDLKENNGSATGCPNQVTLELPRVADTATITGLVERLDEQGNQTPFPNVEVQLRNPTALNAEQVATKLKEDGDFDSFEVGADGTAKYRWTFTPIDAYQQVDSSESPTGRTVVRRRGLPAPEFNSSIFVKDCSAYTNDLCVANPFVLEDTGDNKGIVMGFDSGNKVTKSDIVNAVRRENYLTGDFAVTVSVEHCIPLVESPGDSKVPAEERCIRTEAEGGGAGTIPGEDSLKGYVGKKYYETLEGGNIRVEIDESKIKEGGTFSTDANNFTLLGGLKDPYFYGYGKALNWTRIRYYATIVWQDTNYNASSSDCHEYGLPAQFYLVPNASSDEPDEVWKKADVEDYCTAFIDQDVGEENVTPLSMAEKYGFLLQDWNYWAMKEAGVEPMFVPGDVLNVETVRQIILEKFSDLARPLDSRFDGYAENPTTFIQDEITVVLTASFESVIEAQSRDEHFSAIAQFNVKVDSGENGIINAIDISAADFNPTSKLPTFITTKTDPMVNTLDSRVGEDGGEIEATPVTRNYQFAGISFELSDLLRIGARADRYRTALFTDEGTPRHDLRFDLKQYGGNDNGIIDGSETVRFVEEYLPVGHFEEDIATEPERLDVAVVNMLLEPIPTGSVKGIVYSRDPAKAGSDIESEPCTAEKDGCVVLEDASVYIGEKSGEEVALTASNGTFAFTDVLIGSYQLFATSDLDEDNDGKRDHKAATISVSVIDNTTSEVQIELIKAADGATGAPYIIVESVNIEQEALGSALGVIKGAAFLDVDLNEFDPNDETYAGATKFASGTTIALIVNGQTFPKTLGRKDIIENDDGTFSEVEVATADFEYSFTLQPGKNTVTLAAYNSYGPNLPELPVYELDFTAPVGTVFGQVLKRSDGETPVTGAIVNISGNGFSSITTTDTYGNFRLENVPALQSISVVVNKCVTSTDSTECYAPYAKDVFLSRGGRATMNLLMEEIEVNQDINTKQAPLVMVDTENLQRIEPVGMYLVQGTVTNSDSKSVTVFIKNIGENAFERQKSVDMTYADATSSTKGTYETLITLGPGTNLIQVRSVNSNGKAGYSRQHMLTLPFPINSPTITSSGTFVTGVLNDETINTGTGRLYGTIRDYYQGSKVSLIINGEIIDQKLRDSSIDLSPVSTEREESGTFKWALMADNRLKFNLKISNLTEGDTLTDAYIRTGEISATEDEEANVLKLSFDEGKTIADSTESDGVTGTIALSDEEAEKFLDATQPIYLNVLSSQQEQGLVQGQIRYNMDSETNGCNYVLIPDATLGLSASEATTALYCSQFALVPDQTNEVQIRTTVAVDIDGDGHLDYKEDLDDDGRLDDGSEDADNNGICEWEDTEGGVAGIDTDNDGHCDSFNEDMDGDNKLDQDESKGDFLGEVVLIPGPITAGIAGAGSTLRVSVPITSRSAYARVWESTAYGKGYYSWWWYWWSYRDSHVYGSAYRYYNYRTRRVTLSHYAYGWKSWWRRTDSSFSSKIENNELVVQVDNIVQNAIYNTCIGRYGYGANSQNKPKIEVISGENTDNIIAGDDEYSWGWGNYSRRWRKVLRVGANESETYNNWWQAVWDSTPPARNFSVNE